MILRVDRNLPLPVLEIKANAQDELPDLAESWAWAHAQVSGSARNQDSLEESLGWESCTDAFALVVSRVVSIRSQTTWRALCRRLSWDEKPGSVYRSNATANVTRKKSYYQHGPPQADAVDVTSLFPLGVPHGNRW